jgi:hypothetical protein
MVCFEVGQGLELACSRQYMISAGKEVLDYE